MSGEMTSMERWKALLNGDPVDRIPVVPFAMGQSAIVHGYENLGDFYSKPEVSVKCQLRAMEMFGYDQPPIFLSPTYKGATLFGSEVEYPYRPAQGSVTVTKPVAETPEDLESLEIPDPRGDEKLHNMIEIALDNDVVPIVYMTGGAVSCTAPIIVGIETFMKWMRTDPDLCEVALDKTAEFAKRKAEWLVDEFGADNLVPWTSYPADANVLISAENFGELVLPKVKKHHQNLLDLGFSSILAHWCSDHNKNIDAGHIDKIPHGDPGVMYFGPEVDVERSVELFGDEHIITGNVDPPSVQNKSYEEVLQLCKENIEKGKDSPRGYTLTCGCELPPRAPPINVYAFVKASRKYGKY
ncbi:MAG: Methylcobalamin:coenzyme M methyltransferase MtbA [Candidatus Methanohalarchaeum thermophilum]|uniref:Methylcobalamin:coenzyme M methyltransferase MtbA n=1 Tax=Methanohalarchaeum thermophilum TaxID=1903181 RepID=A0A1Q6DTZ9_METT1|nr:MAG: Methylcobalamin:coenzyme M methyltransferase MtbA [Candidatus Methanohalarchaeum thermophilum]